MRTVVCRLAMLGVLVGACALPARANLIVNGGFEDPVTGQWSNIPGDFPSLPGWTLVSGSVDVVDASFFLPYAGNQSLDLDGWEPGVIEQSFATQVGQLYSLTFVYANNYQGGSVPALATVFLTDSVLGDLLTQEISHGTSSGGNMDYTPFQFSFTASSALTTLRFASGDAAGVGGIVLDEVSVVEQVNTNAVPEPSTVCLMGLGLAGLAGRALRRRRLA